MFLLLALYVITSVLLNVTLILERRENRRLKRGDFTPEEFQNLCHNFSAEDREVFYQGCADYQRRLLGKAHIDVLAEKKV